MGFLRGEQTLGELGAAGKPVRKIERFRNHDAGIAVGPIGGGGALEGHADTKFERREIAGAGPVIIGIANGENLAREDAGLGYGAGVGEIRLGFENSKDDGIALDENFFGIVAIEEFLDRFVKVEAEVRSRAQAAREQILSHLGRTTHVGFNNDVRDDLVLLRLGLVLQNTFVQAVVEPRQLASLLGGNQVN